MKLEEYLSQRSMTQTQFAALVGVEQSAVSQWISGARKPRDPLKIKIREVTKGKVTAEDFLKGAGCDV